jgi:hypothetical protein
MGSAGSLADRWPRVTRVSEETTMTADETIEERLAALEATVAQLQRQILVLKAGPNWLDRVIGSVTDEEAFREALEYGRAYRQSDRPPDEEDDLP